MTLPACITCGAVIDPTMTRRQARTALYRAGWEFVGGGSFASVWRSPNGDRVVKVTKPDPGHDATLEAALAHPDNPHLPTIYGITPLANGGKAIEVEALELGSYDDYETQFVGTNEWWDANSWRNTAHLSPLGEALEALRDAARAARVKVRWDDHEENVMFRPDGKVVLTDLLYAPSVLHDGSPYDDGAGYGRRGSYHFSDAGVDLAEAA